MNDAAAGFVVVLVVDANGVSLGDDHHGPHHPRMNARIAEEERR